MKDLCTVKEAAELLNMSAHTIRYYTDNNLIPGVIRDAHNNRLFGKEAMHWLEVARWLRGCGMGIREIRELIELVMQGDSTAKQRYFIFLKHREVLEQQRQALEQSASFLEEKIQHLESYFAENKIDPFQSDNGSA